MIRFASKGLGVLAALSVLSGVSAAQYGRYGYGGGGSTVQGDILRGEGVFLDGAGNFLYKEALGNSINVDTEIRLNEYMVSAAKYENAVNAQHRAAVIHKQREGQKAILQRIREHPEGRDVTNGDALNDVMAQMLDPKIPPSTYRLHPVQLAGDTIRNVPFLFARRGATFSMRRLTVKHIKYWPVAFRGSQCDDLRRDYERAIDNALDQQIEGKLPPEPILAVERAVKALDDRLHRTMRPSADKVYVEARDHIEALKRAKDLLKERDIGNIIGAIDKYSGTSVYDLVAFMDENKLQFGVPNLGPERELYVNLYNTMKEQLLVAKE